MEYLGSALSGTRVVALVTNVPGPVAVSRLCELGASAVTIEPPHGDPLATAAPRWYAHLHRNVEVKRLSLRDEVERTVVAGLVADADVLLTSTRASALVRAGLQWEDLHRAHPRLSHVAIVGERAPHADRAGHDLTYQARAGLLSPPTMPRTLLADMAAAERAVSAVLAALHARDRDGTGRYVEVAIVDAAIAMSEPLLYGLTGSGELGGALPAYRIYPCADGWVAVAALEPHFLERLKELLDVDRLDAGAIQSALARHSASQWEALANARDVPLAAISTQALGREHGNDA